MTKEEALKIAMKQMAPGSTHKRTVEYGNFFILQINGPDLVEGHLDPFFSVDKTTGDVRDFDISNGGLDLVRQFI